MSIGILLNEEREGPGLIEEVIEEKGFRPVIFHREDFTWPEPQELQALIVMGGPQSANDENRSMQRELAYVREAVERGVPYLGICLGLQVLVKALGGNVVKNPEREVAFVHDDGKPYEVELTEEGRREPLLHGLQSPLPVFHLHGETVVPTLSMATLGTGRSCMQQIVKAADRAYGIQGHFEVTPKLLSCWLQEDAWLRGCDQQLLHAQADLLLPRINAVGRKIFENFLGKIPTLNSQIPRRSQVPGPPSDPVRTGTGGRGRAGRFQNV